MKSPKPIASVSAVMMDAARTYVADGFRVALQGVYIHPHPVAGAVLVATDGHRAVIIHDSKGRCTKPCQVMVSKDLGPALKVAKDSHSVEVAPNGVVTVPGLYVGAEPAFVPSGFAFPEYRRLIAGLLDLIKEGASGPASFNSAYLADVGKVGQRLSGFKGTAARIITFGPSDMALTLWPNIDYAFGFLMPMRSPEVAAVPRFFEPVMRGYATAPEAGAA